MNKKALLIVTSLIIIVIIGVGSLFYFLSFKTVTFTIVPDDIEIVIYNKDSSEAGRLNQDDTLRLQSGNYTATPTNDTYSRTPIPFTVTDQDLAVSIDPSYSFDRLDEILEIEKPIIMKKLQTTYASIVDQFKIESETLYRKGDWFAALLVQNYLPGGQQGDIYKVVMHKTDNQWDIVAGPEIVLTAPNYPDVPREILDDINTRN